MFCCKGTLSISVHCTVLVLRGGLNSLASGATLESTATLHSQPEKYKVVLCKFNFKTNPCPTKPFLDTPFYIKSRLPTRVTVKL